MKKLLKALGVAAWIAVMALAAAPAGAAATPTMKLVSHGIAHDALYCIAFHKNIGIAVGAYGEMLMSKDSGKTWQKVSSLPTQYALLGVGLAQGYAIAVGQFGTILVMQPDGSWKKVESGTKNRLFNVAVQPDGAAVAVGAYGVILRSTDGGKTWKSIAPDWSKGYTQFGDKPHMYAVHVAQNGAITVSGEFGLILHSTDNGASWQTVHKGDTVKHVGDASLFNMQILPNGTGYAVGQVGTVLRTTDGGLTWQKLNTGTAGGVLLGVHATTDGRVVVTGMHEVMVSSDHGQTWEAVNSLAATRSWFEGVASAADGSVIYAVGDGARIVQVDAG